jgi:hypothetical protein
MQSLVNENFVTIYFLMIGAIVPTVTGFFSAQKLDTPAQRTLGFTAMLVVSLAVVFGCGLAIILLSTPTHRTEIHVPGPWPVPSPPPQEVKPEIEDKQNESLLTFNTDSRSKASIRQQFCIDSALGGTVSKSGNNIVANIDTATFNLCNYSSDNHRTVEFKIGIGKREDIAKADWPKINWSKPQRGSITAGQETDLTPNAPIVIPLSRSLQTKLAKTPKNYNVVVSIYNPDRKGLYYLNNDSK